MFSDRDYQESAENSIMEVFREFQSALLVLATGLGKTICFARTIQKFLPKRALVLADTDELIKQAADKIGTVTGVGIEIEKADLYATTHALTRVPVVVSSIQTQISGPKASRRYMRFNPKDFGLLVCDEAHLCAAPSWREVIAYYTARNPELKLLGVTATPDRADKKALVPNIFQKVAFEFGIKEGIKEGWLVDIVQQFINVESMDFSHIDTHMGDLNQGQLAKVMEVEENVQRICQASLEKIWGLDPYALSNKNPMEWTDYFKGLNRKPRRTIVFTVSVDQAEMCSNVFSRAMDGVEWVCGKTSKEDRPRILSRFASGETHVICNAMLLGKGYDNPYVELICQARPTKSRVVYAQQIGRGTRTLPGTIDNIPTSGERVKAIASSAKPYLHVLDFVGNSGKHKLVSCRHILGTDVPEEAIELAGEKMMKDGTAKRVLITLNNAQIELEKRKREAAKKAQLEAEARKRSQLARTTYHVQNVDPFTHSKHPVPFTTCMAKNGKEFTEKQAKVLCELGYDPSKITSGYGKKILGTVPRPKQLSVLRRAGYDTTGWDFQKCLKAIDALVKNGWKKPPEQEAA